MLNHVVIASINPTASTVRVCVRRRGAEPVLAPLGGASASSGTIAAAEVGFRRGSGTAGLTRAAARCFPNERRIRQGQRSTILARLR
ncbi:MAG: hypothetical protein RLN74_05670, partial [Ilumatobacter fluminis]